MTKLIVEMEMPCNIQYLAGLHGTPTCPIERRTCKDGNNPPKWCPIKGVLPDEHGDLIDRDKAKDAFDSSFLTFRMKDGETMRGFYQRTIAELPTVIAAGRKDNAES